MIRARFLGGPDLISCDVTCSFDRYMKQNPDALTWFSKPELALKQRVNDYKNKKQKEKQDLID